MGTGQTFAPDAAAIERLAEAAIARLPERFRRHLDDVVLRIEDFADDEVLAELGIEDPFELTGLYIGRPIGEQDSWASGELPPMIHLYRRPLLDEWAETGVSLEALVTHVIVHEVGHHFGFSDADMHAIEDAGGLSLLALRRRRLRARRPAAVRGADLALGPGEAALVTGPNGAGKSSLIRLAAGLLRAAGRDGRARAAAALADEQLALDERLRARRRARLLGRLDGGDAAAMAAMGLAPLADVPVRMLSTGQRKRAALARVVASGAPLWLLDEPANGLDADGAGAARRRRWRRTAPAAARSSPPRTSRSASPARRRWRSDERASILRELRLAATGGAALLPLVFFLLVATLFPFAVGPDGPLLARTGGGALWMAALLAALLPVDRLVEPDRAAGVLDQLALRGHERGERRARQARRPLAELRPAADARRPARPRR